MSSALSFFTRLDIDWAATDALYHRVVSFCQLMRETRSTRDDLKARLDRVYADEDEYAHMVSTPPLLHAAQSLG